MLQVRDAWKSYGGVQALAGVSLNVPPAQILGLIGPNGSGKSTLFDVVTGFAKMDRGEVSLDGVPLDTRRPDEIARRGMIRTFQIPRVVRRMTVVENLMLPIDEQAGESLVSLLLPWSRARVRLDQARALTRAWEMASLLGLEQVANDYAGTLSGGQLKLLSIGIVLMTRPKILLLDEPTAGVNPVLVRRLISVLADHRDSGLTVFVIEHNLEVIAELCADVYVLDAGRVMAHGTADEVRSDPLVIQAYLGLQRARS